jgi:cytochrome P450
MQLLTSISSLAWAEMRSVLARMIWHFDMELCEESKEGWENQKLFTLWEKHPLMVRLTRRHEASG